MMMLKVLHPNRWLIWTISIAIIVFIFTWGQVKLYAAEIDIATAQNAMDYNDEPLGSLAWRSSDNGNVYLNSKHGFSEAKYPSAWIVKETDSHVYFSNKSHQCVLFVGNIALPDGSYAAAGEKTFTADKGEIKLNILVDGAAQGSPKYIVIPTSGVQKLEGQHILGLIRVGDPTLCADTFGKILSTVKVKKNK